jgi:hypothetical protein
MRVDALLGRNTSESQDCGNIQKPACTKVLKKENKNGNDAPMAALTISGCDIS